MLRLQPTLRSLDWDRLMLFCGHDDIVETDLQHHKLVKDKARTLIRLLAKQAATDEVKNCTKVDCGGAEWLAVQSTPDIQQTCRAKAQIGSA
jgi:hypothetical protein